MTNGTARFSSATANCRVAMSPKLKKPASSRTNQCAKSVRRFRFRLCFCPSALLLPFGILFVLKAAIVTVLGEEGYRQQVDLLREGGFVEQMGAVFMQIDPITAPLSKVLGYIIG